MKINELSVLGGIIANIGSPYFPRSATPIFYVDFRAPDWLSVIGSTRASLKLGGFDNDMGPTRITNVGTPTASTDAATKTYIDNLQTTIASLTSIVNKLLT